MRKIAFLFLFFGFCGAAHAVDFTTKSVVVNSLVSEAVFYASHTCAGGYNITVLDQQAKFYSLLISSAGPAGSWVKVWDANTSTQPHAHVSMIDTIDAGSKSDVKYNIKLSSGILYQSVSPTTLFPCMTFIYGVN